MRFWLARLVSGMASQMLMVAIGWQMYTLTGSAWDLGLVGLMNTLKHEGAKFGIRESAAITKSNE